MKPNIQKICLLISVLWVSISATAYDFEVDGIEYEISSFPDLTVCAVSIGTNFESNLVIPKSVSFNGKVLSVTSMSSSFAANCDKLESVTIDAEIEIIPENAFNHCTSLKYVKIFNSIEIDNGAFENCEILSEVSLPNNLNRLGIRAFANCSSLESINLPHSLTIADNAVFCDCPKLNNVDFRNVVSISSSAFAGCSVLSDILLSEELVNIGDYAFKGTNFESFVIPNSVTNIGEGILSDCRLLNTLTIGSGLSKIESNPCEGAIGLKNLIFTDTDSSLEINFKGDLYKNFWWRPSPVNNNRDINIYYGGFKAFPIEYVYLGRTVVCQKDNLGWKDDYLINPFYGNETIKKVEIGHNVKTLPYRDLDIYLQATYSFRHREDFGYFENCERLEDVIFLGSVHTISKQFAKNTNISSIDIPNSCQSIEPEAFMNCHNLQSVTLGKYVKSIGNDTFSNDSVLSVINLFTVQPPSYSTGFSNQQYINLTVNIPPNTLSLYEEVDPWRSFWNLKEDDNLLTEFIVNSIKYEVITENAVAISDFTDLNITTLDLPNIVNYKENSYTVSKLDFQGSILPECIEAALPPSINELPARIFEGWENLECIDLGQVMSIGAEAFSGCKNLKHISIPATCNIIGNDAFKKCTNLRSIEFKKTDSAITIEHNSNLNLSSSITPFPNPSDVDERRTGFKNGYYNGLFFELPIERLIINRDIELSKYYERTMGNPTPNYSTVYNDVIYYPPFYGLSELKYVEIGENVSAICKNQIEAVVNAVPAMISYSPFGKCENVEVVVANNPSAPVGGGFSQTVYEDAVLFLPNGGADSYRNDEFWKHFSNIQAAQFIPVESISLNTDELTMDINEEIEIFPVINPHNASIKKLKWDSNFPSIVEVSDEGKIKSNAMNGEAIITATACDGSGVSLSVKIIVEAGSAVSEITNDLCLSIQVESDKIIIKGKSDSDLVELYNIQGQHLLSTKQSIIELPTKGFYIVKVGSLNKKIIRL